MNISITPSELKGNIMIPPSKSISHRALICAALSDGVSHIENVLECDDLTATTNALEALGAKIEKRKNNYTVTGIKNAPRSAVIDCIESGSTLRFFIPICAALGVNAVFKGRGKLPQRPIDPIIPPLEENGITFLKKQMPYEISGKLLCGNYKIDGSVSSQFITGLLLSMPVIGKNSCITVTSELCSKPYIDITLDTMKSFGTDITYENNIFTYNEIEYRSCDYSVEADMSQAAFFAVAKALGNDVNITNLNPDSVQGDKVILDIIKKFEKYELPETINAEHFPDLVPILTVLLCFYNRKTIITGCERLKIKECDRLNAICRELNKIGGKTTPTDSSIEIEPIESFVGGICSSHNDHRIAMALAIAALCSKNEIVIENAECTAKSYPGFFEDYNMLGGNANVITD